MRQARPSAARTARTVFISYASRDAADLARRLRGDLEAGGYDVWLDTHRLAGGDSWSREIETALDRAEVVLALLSPGSYVSEICRAEQLRSLRLGKSVIPLLARRDTDVPLHLEARQHFDFGTAADYQERLSQLLAELAAPRITPLAARYRRTYVTAPPLPMNFVERPDALDALRAALFAAEGGRHIALTALRGMGGLGKTVLAQALAHDEVVQQAFPDGVIWVSAGKEATADGLARLREIGKALDDDLTRYDTELGAIHQYRSTIAARAVLIVVDNIWSIADLEPFLAESARSRLLYTTRDSSIAAAVGAHEHVAELLTEEQSRSVLARWAGVTEPQLPAGAAAVIEECGRLPLALAMVGAMVRGKPPAMWTAILDLLRRADLKRIGMASTNLAHSNLYRAVQVSVEALEPEIQARYLALAVVLETMAVEPAVQQALWGLSPLEAWRTAEELVGHSLAQREGEEGAIRLHDLQLDYLRALYPDREALDLIHHAVRLSANVIAGDASQFASQLLGRLRGLQDHPSIRSLAAGLRQHAPRPWLLPLWSSLTPPGATLIRTLEGHSDTVYAVGVSDDWRRVVSASGDKTLMVWGLDSGKLQRTLRGHTNSVVSVAISADGRRAVSASSDRTLRIWDLDSGRLLRTLDVLVDPSRIAMTADGRRAVSTATTSHDRRLNVWDLDSGNLLRTLAGSAPFRAFGLSSGGGRVVTAATVDEDEIEITVWDLESGDLLRTIECTGDEPEILAVSADGRRAVSAYGGQTLKVWDLDRGRLSCTMRVEERRSGRFNAVAIGAGGRRAVSASSDRTLRVWDLDRGRLLGNLRDHSSAVTDVAFSFDGRRAVSASADHTLKIWDLDSQLNAHAAPGHLDAVGGIAVSADGRRMISAAHDGTIGVWDLRRGRLLRNLHENARPPWHMHSVAITADGRRGVVASDWSLKVWDLDNGRLLHTLKGHKGTVWQVAISADGRHAASVSEDKTLKVWDLGGGQLLTTIEHSSSLYAVAVSADGRYAISKLDHRLAVWKLPGGKLLRTFGGPSVAFGGLAVLADGSLAAAVADDGTLTLWDPGRGGLLRTLETRSGQPRGVALSADARRVVVASRDRSVKVWDLENPTVPAVFTCEGPALCCTFAGSHRVVAGDKGGRIYYLKLVQAAPRPQGASR